MHRNKGFYSVWNDDVVSISPRSNFNIWGKCEVLAGFNQKIVMVKQNSCLALAFHPELTNDLRIHQYFLSSIG
ncbi:MAG TPA: hypothetical protein HA348_00565 [Thermoplasmata archaeon]|nr:hypothetical protein [Thermoplasmata archaeon]